jgi:hypothetical protein
MSVQWTRTCVFWSGKEVSKSYMFDELGSSS